MLSYTLTLMYIYAKSRRESVYILQDKNERKKMEYSYIYLMSRKRNMSPVPRREEGKALCVRREGLAPSSPSALLLAAFSIIHTPFSPPRLPNKPHKLPSQSHPLSTHAWSPSDLSSLSEFMWSPLFVCLCLAGWMVVNKISHTMNIFSRDLQYGTGLYVVGGRRM